MTDPTGKRIKAITSKMTDEEYRLIHEAKEKLWPHAKMNDSSIMLSLAMMTVESVLGKKKKG